MTMEWQDIPEISNAKGRRVGDTLEIRVAVEIAAGCTYLGVIRPPEARGPFFAGARWEIQSSMWSFAEEHAQLQFILKEVKE